MKKRTVLFVVLVLTVFSALGVREATAVFYRYTDEKGIVNITDNLQVIPEQYRSSAVMVSDGEPERPAVSSKKKSPEESTAAAPEEPKQEKHGRSLADRLLLSGCITGVGIAVFIMLGKLYLPEQHRKFVPKARAAVIIVLSLYLVTAHLGDILRLAGMAWGTVESARDDARDRGKSAAKTVKKIDTILDGAERNAAQEQEK
jgi:hypothetical protein